MSPASPGVQHETLPARFFANARRFATRTVHRYAARGDWFPVGWATMAAVVRDLASGLMALGHESSEPVAILSRTRREWIYCDLAVLAAGGVTVGLYPTLASPLLSGILAHCEARFLIAESEVDLNKLEPHIGDLPRLETIILLESRAGAEHHRLDRVRVIDYQTLLARGRAAACDVDARIAELTPLCAATFLYTGGTTGMPKGAMLTHGNLVAAVRAFQALGLSPSDTGLSFLPLAHSLQRVFDYLALWIGMPTAYACPDGDLLADMRRVRPTVMAMVPQVVRRLYGATYAETRLSSAGHRLLDWAGQLSRQLMVPGSRSPGQTAQLRLARRLIFNRLRTELGGRLRRILVAGSPLAPELITFFTGCDIEILVGWGMTETLAAGTFNRPGERRLGTVGRPLPGIELALADDGELLVSGPCVFSGYHKAEAETRAAFARSGHFRTGDIARIDGDGFCTLLGRRRDLIVTSGGDNVAPENIENRFHAEPCISQIIVIGDKRPYLVALVAVSETLRRLFDEPTIHRIVEGIIATTNIDLRRAEQIRQFRLLPYELTRMSGELTPTFQVRREVVERRFGYLVDEMYE